MTTGSVERPKVGWHGIPGDPDARRWWDGTSFTHEARRTGDTWEITDSATSTSTATPAPDRRRERLVLGWVVALLGPWVVLFLVLVPAANDPETNSGTGMVVTILVFLVIGVVGCVVGGIAIARSGRDR